jgi:TolA-binding protein
MSNSVHYAYGNADFEQANYVNARRSYENCLSIGQAELPTHPITAAAYYSLGCTEFALHNDDLAKYDCS